MKNGGKRTLCNPLFNYNRNTFINTRWIVGIKSKEIRMKKILTFEEKII